jgi:hypothetical protein
VGVEMKEKIYYGTWIRKKKIALFLLLLAAFVGLAFMGSLNPVFWLFIIPALPFGYIVFILSLTYYRFSPAGNDFQEKIHQLIAGHLKSAGALLDIGCGSGKLAIKLAKKHSASRITGLD